MKIKVFAFIIAVVSLLCVCTANAAVNTSSPSRCINVVYDDSGSMIKNHDQLVDTWCQAKYAMEVFASMLDSEDIMNVYVMSDFEYDTEKGPRLSLKGQDGAAANVSKVHEMVTTAGNTPFNSVRKAYGDTVAAKADEKWLVVLTDGEFQGIDNMDAFFGSKDKEVNVMFLGMGPDAGGISANTEQSIYYVKAKDNSEILEKIIDISTQIFNRDKLDVNVNEKSFSFDIPMKELIIFAQGENVSVKGIKDDSGNIINTKTTPVSVKYSEKPAENYPDFIVDKSLQGCIATFSGDFTKGEYSLDISNAQTVEIYYKPNIEIAAYLKDSNGEEVTDLADIAAGEYTIDFGFVKSGTKEQIASSKLLGNVTYEAVVTNNGTKHEKTYNSGDKIQIEEGPLVIDVTGRYLDYNSVSTHMDYTVFKDKTLSFEVINDVVYTVEKSGFVEDAPVKVKVSVDGKDITKEQWDTMTLPQVKLEDFHEFKLGDFKVEKSDEIGVLNIMPQLDNNKPSVGTYTDSNCLIAYDEQHGNESWKGESEILIKMNDNRSWIVRNIKRVIFGTIALLLFLILLGYMPFVKHYLPRSLKNKPTISCMPNMPGMIPHDVNGKFEKTIHSTILPYVAQKGEIKFIPSGVSGVPKMKVKGIKGKRMTITNIKAYAGKDYITFNGESIEKDYPKRTYDTSAGITICVNRSDWTYTCQPNM